MKITSLFLRLVGIAIIGVLAFVFTGDVPQVGGMLAGASLVLLVALIVGIRYGHRTIGSILPKKVVLKIVLSFVGTVMFYAGFMFASLAIMAKNPEREEE